MRRCVIVQRVQVKLVSTGVAAKELGISRYTLVRWWQDGAVTPQYVTAGGQGRWDMDELRQQLAEFRRRLSED